MLPPIFGLPITVAEGVVVVEEDAGGDAAGADGVSEAAVDAALPEVVPDEEVVPVEFVPVGMPGVVALPAVGARWLSGPPTIVRLFWSAAGAAARRARGRAGAAAAAGGAAPVLPEPLAGRGA